MNNTTNHEPQPDFKSRIDVILAMTLQCVAHLAAIVLSASWAGEIILTTLAVLGCVGLTVYRWNRLRACKSDWRLASVIVVVSIAVATPCLLDIGLDGLFNPDHLVGSLEMAGAFGGFPFIAGLVSNYARIAWGGEKTLTVH
jgi:hypothetical protein